MSLSSWSISHQRSALGKGKSKTLGIWLTENCRFCDVLMVRYNCKKKEQSQSQLFYLNFFLSNEPCFNTLLLTLKAFKIQVPGYKSLSADDLYAVVKTMADGNILYVNLVRLLIHKCFRQKNSAFLWSVPNFVKIFC